MRRTKGKVSTQSYRASYGRQSARSGGDPKRRDRPPKLLIGLISALVGLLAVAAVALLLLRFPVTGKQRSGAISLTDTSTPPAQSASPTAVPPGSAAVATAPAQPPRVSPVPPSSTGVLVAVDQPTLHDFTPADQPGKATALLAQLGVPADETGIGSGPGGISPADSLPLLSEINDISGAVYDAANSRLLLLGSYNPAWPKLDPSDLVVALRATYSNDEDIGVSIDPIDATQFSGPMQVSYFGVPRDTHFAAVMFEADRYLKTLSSGQDNITEQPVDPGVPGYRSELDLMLEQEAASEVPQWHRMWYVLHDSLLQIRTTAESDAMAFGEVPIVVQARFVVFDARGQKYDAPGSSPVIDAFVQHFNNHFADFAARKPEVRQLVQLSKLLSIARWLRSHGVVIDAEWLDAYSLGKTTTPDRTPGQAVTKTRTKQLSNGSVKHTAMIFGGVDFNFTNEESVVPAGDALNNVSEQAKRLPLDQTVGESPALNDAGTLKVVATALRPSNLTGNLVLNRHIFGGSADSLLPLDVVLRYDSFDTRPSVLGKGWSIDPLRAVSSEPATYSINDTQVPLYNVVTLMGPAPGRRRRYVITNQVVNGRVVYTLQEGQGATELYYDLAEQLYTVTDDGIENSFDAAGWLQKQRLGAESIGITRDSAGNPTAFSHSDGRVIRLRYEGGRLIEITGADGAQVQMQYEGQNLTGTTEPEGAVQIAYAGGYPSRISDPQGRSEFVLDSLGRLTRKRSGDLERVFDYAADGSSTERITGVPGRSITVARDARGAVTRITTIESGLAPVADVNTRQAGVMADDLANQMIIEPNEMADIKQALTGLNPTQLRSLQSLREAGRQLYGIMLNQAELDFLQGVGAAMLPVAGLEKLQTYGTGEQKLAVYVDDDTGGSGKAEILKKVVRHYRLQRQVAGEIVVSLATSGTSLKVLAGNRFSEITPRELETFGGRLARKLAFLPPLRARATLSAGELALRYPKRLGQLLLAEGLVPAGNGVIGFDGDLTGLNFQQVFSDARVYRTQGTDVEAILRRQQRLNNLKISLDDIAFLNGIPHTEDGVLKIGKNIKDTARWRAVHNKWRAIGEKRGVTAAPASADALLAALESNPLVVVLVAHSNGYTIFLPDGSQFDIASLSPGVRQLIARNAPVVWLFSCRAGSIQDGQSLAQGLLDLGATSVIAPVTDIKAEGSTVVLEHFLDAISKGKLFLDALDDALKDTMGNFQEHRLGRAPLHGTAEAIAFRPSLQRLELS